MISNITIKKSACRSLIFLSLYKLALDASYYLIVSKVWGYSGFVTELSLMKLAESWVLLFMVFALMPKLYQKISDLIVWLLIIMSYVPLLTIYPFMDQPRIYAYAVAGFWLLVFLLMKLSVPRFSFIKHNQSKMFFWLIAFFFSGLTLFLLFRYFDFVFNFDLTKVYSIRSHYVSVKIPFSGYVFNWVANIVNPIIFAICLKKKKWIFAGFVVLFQLFLFSVTGMKTFLFALPFVLLLIWVMKRKNPLAWLCAGMASAVIAGMISYFAIDDLWTTSLFTRRTLLVPAQLSFMYYDFFSQNEHTLLSQHKIFDNFINYPYKLSPPNLIAAKYFNSPQMSANNGVYADAYMNFGFLGFIFWGALLAIMLKLFDGLSREKNKSISIAAIALPSIVLVNSPLLTAFCTHGILLSLLMLYLMPKERANYK